MKKFVVLTALFFGFFAASGQFIHKIKADSVLITNDSCNAELNLENSTRNVKGFLFNKGNGRTEFRKGFIKLGDSLYTIGVDTLNLDNSGVFWKLKGNAGTNPPTNFLGTTDSAKLVFKTFDKQRASIWANGVLNIGSSDTASRPIFRFYPNGDFAAGATNDYTHNQFETKNGIRFNKKLGILEVGVSNNLDTSLSVSQGIYEPSGLIVNSDNHNTIGGTMISSIISGDGITLGTGKSLNWSIVSGEQHYLNGGIRKSIINGWGNQIYSYDMRSSIITGDINRIDSVSIDNVINGIGNRDYDSSYSTLVTGTFNRFSGHSQLLAGINLISKNWAATTLGSANVDFSSLPAVKVNKPVSLKNYPVFAIGNSNDYNTTRSNAVTILYNGRTQINTTGYDTTLSEAGVTPKAALEVVSKNSGVLLPKLTNIQRNSMAGGDLHNGLLLYNTDSSRFQFYDGSIWKSIADNFTTSANFWNNAGNGGTNPSSNFLGTTDAQRLVFRTKNIERVTIDTVGNVGIGTSSPVSKLHSAGTVKFQSLGTSVSDTSTYKPLVISSAGDVLPMTNWAGSSSYRTANNGLTDSAGRVILGGNLYKTATIQTNSYDLQITKNTTGSAFIVSNTAAAAGGTAIETYSNNFIALNASSSSDNFPTATFGIEPTTLNTVKPVIQLFRSSSTGTPTDGVGVSITFNPEDASGILPVANSLESKWVDVTHASRTSQFDITGVNSAITETFANFQTSGIVRVNNLVDTLATKAYARSLAGSGSVITSLNSLTGATQIFAAGTTGTDFGISSSGTTHTFNIPDAGAGARGLMTTGTQTFAGAKTFSSAPTLSTMTTGSVLFAGSGGLVSQNNANLLWDNTNNRLGLNTASPQYKLDVTGDARITSLPFLAGRDTVLTYDPVTKQLKTTSVITGASVWGLTGNAGTSPSTNFLGTTDGQRLVFRTKNNQLYTMLNLS